MVGTSRRGLGEGENGDLRSANELSAQQKLFVYNSIMLQPASESKLCLFPENGEDQERTKSLFASAGHTRVGAN